MPQPTSIRKGAAGQTQSTPAANKPVDKFTDGPVHVSIWENSGAKGAFRTATIELRYKDKQEEWQTSRSYTASDLKHLESAAHEARARIETWRSAEATRSPGP